MKLQNTRATSTGHSKWLTLVLFIAALPFISTSCGESTTSSTSSSTAAIERIECPVYKPLVVIHPQSAKVGDKVTVQKEDGETLNTIHKGNLAVNFVADEPLAAGDQVKVVMYEQTDNHGGRTFKKTVRFGIVKIHPESEKILTDLKEAAENPPKVARK